MKWMIGYFLAVIFASLAALELFEAHRLPVAILCGIVSVSCMYAAWRSAGD